MLRLSSVYRAAIRSCYFAPLFLILSYSAPSQALGLMEAWQHALTHDPAFLAAVHARNADSEEKHIGRAGLLPKSPMTTASPVTILPLRRETNSQSGITLAALPAFPCNSR